MLSSWADQLSGEHLENVDNIGQGTTLFRARIPFELDLKFFTLLSFLDAWCSVFEVMFLVNSHDSRIFVVITS